MRLKHKRAYIQYISVVICLSVVFSNSEAVILCISEDGHIAVETASSDCCAGFPVGFSENRVFASDERDQPANSDDCGPCVDIPLSAGLAGTVTVAKQRNLTILASAPIGSPPAQSHQFSELRLAIESFTLISYFTPLRSIILLI